MSWRRSSLNLLDLSHFEQHYYCCCFFVFFSRLVNVVWLMVIYYSEWKKIWPNRKEKSQYGETASHFNHVRLGSERRYSRGWKSILPKSHKTGFLLTPFPEADNLYSAAPFVPAIIRCEYKKDPSVVQMQPPPSFSAATRIWQTYNVLVLLAWKSQKEEESEWHSVHSQEMQDAQTACMSTVLPLLLLCSDCCAD